MGHLGAEWMVVLAREGFFWPNMRAKMEHYVTQLCFCKKRNKLNTVTRTLIQSIQTSAPFDLLRLFASGQV